MKGEIELTEIEKTKVPADKIENPVNQKPAKELSIVVHVDTIEIDLAKQKANELVAELEKAHELIHSLNAENSNNTVVINNPCLTDEEVKAGTRKTFDLLDKIL